MNGFFVTISNDLLEDKHLQKMGNAVWLYMWFIDKMTEISEGLGIIQYGHAINLSDVRENFPSMSERTYQRMIQTLRDAGYINTVKAKHGLYVTVNKPKKHFGNKLRPAKSGVTKQNKPIKTRQKRSLDPPKLSARPAKSGVTLYSNYNTTNNTDTIVSTNVDTGDKKSPAKNTHKELVSKLYYEAIKALDLPVRNHSNVKAKITELAGDRDHEKIINYLTFMRDQYGSVDWDYKPHISEALDIFNKRGVIRDTFKKYVKTAATDTATAWRPKNRGATK